MIETHISVLFFVGDRVYKMRKPVKTPFLDFSTRELRLADCRREVELNRRLAPDVYLGVHDVIDESDAPVEHLVVMRRLPADRRLATMVTQPGFDENHLVGVARRIGAFHARAERSARIDNAGSDAHLRMLWTTNLEETAAFAGRFIDGARLARLGAGALAYLDGRGALFGKRVAQGRIVDGHGDLLAQDIFCMDDGPRILDCVEFDSRFRWGDVLYDTAFLAMDLEHLGRPDLARRFLAAYREFSAETHPESLEHWYVAYRALVRAKIACLRAAIGDPAAPGEAESFCEQAARHVDQAAVHLVIVGGLPGTGKTTVAEGLADRVGWALLRSDEVRKDLAGIPHTEHAYSRPFEGLYTPEATREVYRELLRRAGVAASMGDSVVLDASWLDPAEREQARALAAAMSARFHELCCVLPVEQAAQRIRARVAAGSDASDATAEVLARLAGRAEVPWAGSRIIDTSTQPAAAVDMALAIVRPDLSAGAARTKRPAR